MGNARAMRETPAVTMVAACIRALTGVGPCIASGSQVNSGSCADLAVAPTRSSRPTAVTIPASACAAPANRSEEHTSELQSRENLVCRLLLEKKKKTKRTDKTHKNTDRGKKHYKKYY